MKHKELKQSGKTSLVVSGLVTLVAAVHYFYMRDVWVETGDTPTVYRYIDWLITVPLLMIEFYLILRAITNVSGGIFWRLTIGTLVMLIGGYLGEAGYMNVTLGFVIGMVGWAYILYEIFAGEAGKVAAESLTCSGISIFNNALDCDHWLGHLSARLLLRLHGRWCRHGISEHHLQSG